MDDISSIIKCVNYQAKSRAECGCELCEMLFMYFAFLDSMNLFNHLSQAQ